MTSRWDGAAYSSVGQMQRELAMAEVEAIDWRGDERVLDVGCGDGAISAQMASRVPRGQVLGLDVSSGQISYATEQHAAANLRFEVQDAVRLRAPWPADVVTSFNALHWVHDLPRALEAIARATRPGGLLAIRVVALGDRPSLEAVIRRTYEGARWNDSFQDFRSPVEHVTQDVWSGLLSGAGFDDVQAQVEDRSWDFGSRAGFAAWLRANAGTWTFRLPDDRVSAFVEDVLDNYQPITGSPGLFRFYQLRLRAYLHPTRRDQRS